MNRRAFLRWTTGGAALVLGPPSGLSHAGQGHATAGGPSPDRGSIRSSLRIGIGLWSQPERLAELLAWCRKYREVLDEVALFTSTTHAALPLETIRVRARALADALPRFRDLGIGAGINHLATLGHMDEQVDQALNEPWERFTDSDGSSTRACYCASDPRVVAYVERTYEVLAAAGPDFLWIDDDLRFEGHGHVRFACFCAACLRRFSDETAREWTRETLVTAFNGGPRADRLALRRAWLAHNRRYMTDLMRAIRAAVDRVAPGLPLGYMSTELTYSGYGWYDWPAALAGPAQPPVKWRPGGGFYTDDTPAALLGKAHAVGRQLSHLPLTVRDRQYEHENYPYQRLKKSVTVFTAEVAAAIGAGCTGVAVNCLGLGSDPFDEFQPYFDGLRARQRFHERAVAAFGGSRCEGIWPAFTQDHFAALNPEGDWFGSPAWGSDLHLFNEMAELGLPMAYHPDGARVTLLAGYALLQFSPEDLRRFLASGVLLDGPALQRLDELGLAEPTGFKPRTTRSADSIEVLADHSLNGRFAGRQRDCRTLFSPEPTWLIEPTNPAAQIVARIVDFTRQTQGPTAGCFENALGGRVVVAGYHAWRNLASEAKSAQTRALCRWLSRDTLPALIGSYHRAALWCRRSPEGQPAVLVLNASLDRVERLTLLVREAARLRLTGSDGRTTTLRRRGTDGPYGVFELPGLGPWEPALVVGAAAV